MHCLDELMEGSDGGRHRSVVVATLDDHCHLPKPKGNGSRRAITKLLITSVLTLLFMITEIVGGYLANSIAIMSDAAHMFSDLTSFIVSLTAISLAMRPASRQMNFGYHRAEVLGALISVLMIWVITGVLVYAAAQRVMSMEFVVDGDTMIIVAALGVIMNIIQGIVLHSGGGGHGHSHGGLGSARLHSDSNASAITSSGDHQDQQPDNSSTQVNVTVEPSSDAVTTTTNTNGTGPRQNSAPTNNNSSSNHNHSHDHEDNNINIRAAFIHVIGDLLQSVGVLVAAYIIRYYPEYKIADPICTFLFSVLVMFTTVPIIRDLGRVLMEGVPLGVDYTAICAHLTALPGVRMVHSLHVWTLTIDKNACSVHLAVSSDCDPDSVLRGAQRVIRSRHHIYHTTIQVEPYNSQLMDNCNQCQPLP
uniref:Zinc transporter 2-like isoform X2 n=2 Tax=Hirondellea gigas TaxID=1518452 RepID=A0A6A7FY60_9CRUS